MESDAPACTALIEPHPDDLPTADALLLPEAPPDPWGLPAHCIAATEE